eukprot:scaffold113260_cov63-Cyclotella_meneghiniana.AAC.1
MVAVEKQQPKVSTMMASWTGLTISRATSFYSRLVTRVEILIDYYKGPNLLTQASVWERSINCNSWVARGREMAMNRLGRLGEFCKREYLSYGVNKRYQLGVIPRLPWIEIGQDTP